MCGIAGILESPAGVEPGLMERLLATLRHRGPDDEGLQRFGNSVLGHRRLSIIDIEGGKQPICTPDGRYGITFNGEIYNYLELRKELESQGYAFRTRSDTEVLLAAFITWGEGCLLRFNGMFSFAIWDRRDRRLFAARDRLGKKPFYYALPPAGGMIFASEAHTLLQSGLVDGRLQPASLDAFLHWGYIPPDRTAFENVHTLPPGHFLTWSPGSLQVRRYWTPEFREAAAIGEEEAAEKFRHLLDEAVRYRMISDVPVGAFLSGGLDSSTIVALMQRRASSKVQTFSAGFGDLINELPYARAVARQEGTEHREIQIDIPVADKLREIARIYDEPFADSSNIPTYEICRAARKHVKVVLTGDGGDELLGGYDWWYQPLAQSGAERTPYPLLWIAGVLAGAAARAGIPLGPKAQEWRHRRALAARARRFPDLFDRHLDGVACLPAALRRRLWRIDAVAEETARCPGTLSGLNRAFWFDLTHYLPGDILVKMDRAAMAVGLETRCPFLDPALVEFALSLSERMKVRDGRGKHIFRKAFEGTWPTLLRGRAKEGFGAPERAWLVRPDVRDLARDSLLGADSPLRGMMNARELSFRVESFYAGRRGLAANQLWALLTLELWLRENQSVSRR